MAVQASADPSGESVMGLYNTVTTAALVQCLLLSPSPRSLYLGTGAWVINPDRVATLQYPVTRAQDYSRAPSTTGGESGEVDVEVFRCVCGNESAR